MEKTRNLRKIITASLVFFTLIGGQVFADAPAEVGQVVNLLTDMLNWVLVIVPVAGGLMVAYHSLMKIMADGDAGEIADRNKKIKMIFMSSVVAFIGAGILRLVVGYFS